MSEPITLAEVQRFLDENFAPWVLALSPKVAELSAEGMVLEMPITDEIARVGGIVSGQSLAALADTAMVLACGVTAGEMAPVGTVTLDTQFLRPGSGEVGHLRDEAACAAALLPHAGQLRGAADDGDGEGLCGNDPRTRP